MKKTKNGTPTINQEQLIKLLKESPKGLTVLGPVGIGKSWAFEQVFKTPVKMWSANDISALYATKGMEGIQESFTYELQGRLPLVIDDIGTEIIMANYGVKLDVVEWLILQCYNTKTKMYFTTNLTLEALTERYGQRVVDRIKEITYIIVLEGDNHREAAYNKTEQELKNLL